NTADPATYAVAIGGAPVYHSNLVNGKGAVRLSRAGFDRFNIAGGGIPLSDWTVFVVHQTSGDCCFLGSGGVNVQMRIAGARLPRHAPRHHPQGAPRPAPPPPRAAGTVAESRHDKAVMSFQEAGAGRAPGQFQGPGTFDQIGSISGNAFLDGDVAEILIF